MALGELAVLALFDTCEKCAVLELKGVGFKYKSIDSGGFALERINFSALPGLITVIRGESGFGKSTILHILSLLERPLSGTVRYNGLALDVKSDSVKSAYRLKNIGFIFQHFALIKEFSVLENCSMPLVLNGMPRKAANRKALAQLKALVGEHDFNLSPSNFSGGQQQRIAVIRATIHKPHYLIADEPTGSLDQRNASLVKDKLRQYADAGNTVVVVSHDDDYCSQADSIFQLTPSRVGTFTLLKTKG